jgi:hypothetical protein
MFTFINITNAAAFRDRVASVLEVLGAQGVTAEDVRAEFLAAGENKLEGLDAWERLDRLENPTAAELRLLARVLRVNTTWLITGDVRFVPELMAGTCLCWPVPPSMWTTHYGAVEPGSTHEYNPDCPEHGEGRRLTSEGVADLFPVAAFGPDHAEAEARA